MSHSLKMAYLYSFQFYSIDIFFIWFWSGLQQIEDFLSDSLPFNVAVPFNLEMDSWT